MSDVDLLLIERAASRGLIPAEALERARRECRGPAAEWLLDEKLLTREQLGRLLEDEIPLLPRSASKDSSWAVIVFFFVIAGAVLFGFTFYSYSRPRHLPPGTPPAFLPEVEGARAMAAGNYRLAATYYTQAIGRSPRDANLYGLRASCHQQMKNIGAALSDAEEAVALEPANVSVHVIRAGILIELGRAQDAVDALEKLPPSPERDSMLQSAKTIVETQKK